MGVFPFAAKGSAPLAYAVAEGTAHVSAAGTTVPSWAMIVAPRKRGAASLRRRAICIIDLAAGAVSELCMADGVVGGAVLLRSLFGCWRTSQVTPDVGWHAGPARGACD